MEDFDKNSITKLIELVAHYFNYSVEEVSQWSRQNIISAYSDIIKEEYEEKKVK